MQPYAHFKYIELKHIKFIRNLALVSAFISLPIALLAMAMDDPVARNGPPMWGFILIFCFLSFMVAAICSNPAIGLMLDSKNRICSNCETKVPTNAIMQTCTFDVLGVTDSTRAITSTNAVSGVTSTGGRMGVGVGSIQSTSHVPIKMGRLKFTASCPSCKAVFSWNEDRQVTQWTSPSGQVSYEIVGRVDLP